MHETPRPRRRSRIAHFKAPFVISVAVPAVFGVACGGKTEPTSLEQTSLTGESPVTGSPCDERSPQPEASSGCPAAECIGGQWEVYSCNPPPVEDCPGAPPPSPDPDCPSTPRCEDGEWILEFVACNPPPPSEGCPVEEPAAGDSCAAHPGGLTCEYEFCYGGRVPLVVCSEVTGLWELLPQLPCNPPPPPCFADFSCGESSADAGAPRGTDAGALDGGR